MAQKRKLKFICRQVCKQLILSPLRPYMLAEVPCLHRVGGVRAAEHCPCKRDLRTGKESGPAPSKHPRVQRGHCWELFVPLCPEQRASPMQHMLLGL